LLKKISLCFSCYGPVDHFKESGGSGCILAHCMGLGKTLQLITLLHTLIRYPELHTKRVLVICPKSTIFNWFEEIKKWLNDIKCIKFIVRYLEENQKIDKRIETLEEWYESPHPAVFLINYEAFRTLVHWSGTSKRSKIPMPEHIVKKLQAKIEKYLLNPGPNLVVCDEGHLIKNQKGATNKAITKISTKRRIILTGTPVQVRIWISGLCGRLIS
jgi:transcriptional regulator ATRX